MYGCRGVCYVLIVYIGGICFRRGACVQVQESMALGVRSPNYKIKFEDTGHFETSSDAREQGGP